MRLRNHSQPGWGPTHGLAQGDPFAVGVPVGQKEQQQQEEARGFARSSRPSTTAGGRGGHEAEGPRGAVAGARGTHHGAAARSVMAPAHAPLDSTNASASRACWNPEHVLLPCVSGSSRGSAPPAVWAPPGALAGHRAHLRVEAIDSLCPHTRVSCGRWSPVAPPPGAAVVSGLQWSRSGSAGWFLADTMGITSYRVSQHAASRPGFGHTEKCKHNSSPTY